jgi:20S proteasome alpha/beta subunit
MSLKAIAAAFAMLTLPLTSDARENPSEDFVVHGAINVVLANENGLVVLTDSMLTVGSHQIAEPGQKLFRLDDRTVCTIAGFVSAGGPVPELFTSTSGIIREYSKQLARNPPQTIAAKLSALAFLFELHLSGIANVRDAAGMAKPGDDYALELIVAGYDTDGLAKIGKITLRTDRISGGLMSTAQDASISNVGKQLVWKLGGQPDVAKKLLESPASLKQDTLLALYASSLDRDGGQSLTIQQMTQLATRLAFYTSKTYPSVGA